MKLSLIRISLALIFIASGYTSLAQEYFVVIGSFRNRELAKDFSDEANSQQYNSQILDIKEKDIHYVYVLKTNDRRAASKRTTELKRTSPYKDAWLFTYNDSPVEAIAGEPLIEEVKIEQPVVQSSVESIQKVEENQPPVIIEESNPNVDQGLEENDKVAVSTPVEPAKARGKFFIFQVITPEGEPVEGKIYNVDRIQGRDLATYLANRQVDVLRPVIQGTPITIVT